MEKEKLENNATLIAFKQIISLTELQIETMKDIVSFLKKIKEEIEEIDYKVARIK